MSIGKIKIFFGGDKHFTFPKSVLFVFKFCKRGVKHTVLFIQMKSPSLKLSVSDLLGQYYKNIMKLLCSEKKD